MNSKVISLLTLTIAIHTCVLAVSASETNIDNAFLAASQGKFSQAKTMLAALVKARSNASTLTINLDILNLAIKHKLNKKATMFYFQAQLYHLRGNLHDAQQYYAKAIKLAPKQAEFYLAKAEIYQQENKKELALLTYHKALKHKVKSPLIYLKIGMLHNHNKNQNLAIKNYNKAIAIDSNFSMAYLNRGNSYYDQGFYKKSIKDFSKTIALAPKNYFAYYFRAMSYHQVKKYDQAIADLNQAIIIKPSYKYPYILRGLLYLKQLKSPEKACADWLHACKLGYCLPYEKIQSKGLCKTEQTVKPKFKL